LRLPIKVKNAKLEVTAFKMAAAAMLEIQVHAIKWAITTRFRSKLVHKLKKRMLSSKITEAEVQVKFQDGRQRHIGKFK
jgi:uncharacterized paraquat-inducible protein A